VHCTAAERVISFTRSEVIINGLFCRSVFGEDALVNVSVEKQSDGKLAGFIRIRSKTQVCTLLTCHCTAFRITLSQQLVACATVHQPTWSCPHMQQRAPVLASDWHPCSEAHTGAPLLQGIALSLGDKLILKQKA
jgi:Coatomer beta subunit appendage platform